MIDHTKRGIDALFSEEEVEKGNPHHGEGGRFSGEDSSGEKEGKYVPGGTEGF